MAFSHSCPLQTRTDNKYPSSDLFAQPTNSHRLKKALNLHKSVSETDDTEISVELHEAAARAAFSPSSQDAQT